MSFAALCGVVCLCALSGCLTEIKTNEQMRDAIVHDRIRSVKKALTHGYPWQDEITYCFPIVPFAAAMNREKLVLEILDLKLDPKIVDQANCMGLTSLHFAALNHNTSFKRELLARHADPTLKDQENHTADDY